jgi:hypothetical protein
VNPFTEDELFDETGMATHVCKECGSAVVQRGVHTEWHNKVADL